MGASLRAAAETFSRDPVNKAVAVADGYGLRIRVERGHLEISDGVGPYRRVREFSRATHGLSRVVVIGHTGSLSLEAVAWCHRLGIGLVVLNADGDVMIAESPRRLEDARLRRMQARAVHERVGLDIAARLLGAKLLGQANLVRQRFGDEDTAGLVAELAEALGEAETIEQCRGIEANAASAYFAAWAGRSECAPRFAAQDRRRTPSHWTRYEGRRSVLSSAVGNRRAERPTNSIINYCMALAECEAVFALHAVGCDPSMGIVHQDAKGRASFALDLLEPLRPQIEGFVLDLVAQRTFRKSDFVELSNGHVRLRPPLTHELAEAMPAWSQALAPWAEHVAHALGRAMAGKYEPSTPLTRRRIRSAQALVKACKASASTAARSAVTLQQPSRAKPTALWSCPDCGGRVTNHRRVRCDDCVAKDPAQTPEVRGRRGAAIAARKRVLAEWERSNPGTVYDREIFRRDILPGLATIPLAEIARAAGCSKAYASDIRRGKWTPHISTWPALAHLVRIEVTCAASGDLANTRGVPSTSTKRSRDNDHSDAARQ
ncbi:MAG: CRISPR-associated endonuclease Cas1 [Acidimicrobiales bacterium]